MRFEGDGRTEIKRCLMLPNVPDVSNVTSCRMVEEETYFQLTLHRIIWQLLSNKMQHNTVYLILAFGQHVLAEISPIISSS